MEVFARQGVPLQLRARALGQCLEHVQVGIGQDVLVIGARGDVGYLARVAHGPAAAIDGEAIALPRGDGAHRSP